MDRIEILKKFGLVGAVVVDAPVNQFPRMTKTTKDDSCRIFFATMDDKMYLLFDNGNRIFKNTIDMSGDHFEDMKELKVHLVDSMIDYYENL